MSDHFLTKTTIDLGQCLDFGDGLAIEAYPTLLETLRNQCGDEVAQLFAEPLLSRGNDQSAPSVSWYTGVVGNAQPYGRLDASQQASVKEELSRILAPVKGLVDDPEHGALIASALHLSDTNDVWAVDGTPVIINWGMLPKGMGRDQKARAAHYAQTLGAFLPLAGAPPLNAAERVEWTAQNAQTDANNETTASTASTVAATGVGTVGGVVAGEAMGQADTPPPTGVLPNDVASEPARVPLWAWLPLLLLILLALVTLIWLLIPGNRLFPDNTADRAITDEAALSAAADVNRALERRLADLQAALDGAVCVDDGTLLMPDGRTIEGLLPPNPNDRTDVPGAVRPADRTAILPPDPERVQIPDGSSPQDTRSLLAYIEERTAIVLAPSSSGLGSGTGFFVGPDLLITNHHVISGQGTTGIYITNKDLGTVHQAEVIKTLGPFEATGGDFALLRVPGVQQPAFTLLDASDSLRLQSVIAAGYPGDLLQSDAQFQRLRSGDRSAVPELAVTDGTVSAEQDLNAATSVVVHSAPISKGNSGGPLIDMCGRLVGVNTFVKKGALRNLNFALSTRDLTRFLNNTGALPQVVTQTCTPQVQRPAAPQAADATIRQPEAGDTPQSLPQLTPRSE